MSMQWPPDAKLDPAMLREAADAYVRHLLDGTHKDMGVVVVVVNRQTGEFHWGSSLGEADTRALLDGARGARVKRVLLPLDAWPTRGE